MLKTLLAFFLLSSPLFAQVAPIGFSELYTPSEINRSHIYLNFDPYLKKHQHYVAVFQADWNISWVKRLNPAHLATSSPARQKFLRQHAEAMDRRVSLLKTGKVTYHLSRNPNLPSPAYKLGQYKQWKKFPDDLKTLPGFYVRFAEWMHHEWNHDVITDNYIKRKKAEENERLQEEAERFRSFLQKNYYKKEKIRWFSNYTTYNWQTDSEEVNFTVETDQTYEWFDHEGVVKTGYQHLPAVAWRRYPKPPTNPILHPYRNLEP